MTDNLKRVFVEVKFDEKAAKGEQVAALVGERLKDFPYQFSITLNKPPSVFTDQEIEDRFMICSLSHGNLRIGSSATSVAR